MEDIYIARQPIFDSKMRVYAYELLFRLGHTSTSEVADGDQASSQVILNAFLEMGIERIAGDRKVFVNFTRNLLLDNMELPLDPQRIVLEILEDIPVDDELLAAVRLLKERGFTLALDDYGFEPDWEPLLPLVDIIKLEIPILSTDKIRAGMPMLKAHGLRTLAEKVETEEKFQELANLGIDYFQGYFFSRPKVIEGKRLEDNQLIILRLLATLNNPDAEINTVENLISKDPGLSYKVLRFINSAAMGMPRRVDSIQQAIVYIGLTRLRGLASLLVLSGIKGKPQEYFNMTMQRAFFCEALIRKANQGVPDVAFTAGLLSTLDLMMGRPLTEILDELALSSTVHDAIIARAGTEGQALTCAIAFESAGKEHIAFPMLGIEEIIAIYVESSERVFAQLRELSG